MITVVHSLIYFLVIFNSSVCNIFLVPSEFLLFIYIIFGLIRHCQIHQFFASLYPRKTFCLAYSTFANSIHTFKWYSQLFKYCSEDAFTQSHRVIQHARSSKQTKGHYRINSLKLHLQHIKTTTYRSLCRVFTCLHNSPVRLVGYFFLVFLR